MSNFSIFINFLPLVIHLCVAEDVTLDLKQGTVAGQRDSYHGVDLFKGVPYAQPPVGSARWNPPMKLNSFDELNKDEFQHQTHCIPSQVTSEQPIAVYGEDCLVLNIYRPSDLEPSTPIMIWIHGGGMQTGSGMSAFTNATHLAKLGNIVVNINYRLGILGFMNHFDSDTNSPQGGNYGLLDQQMALEFIYENAERIGGDPNRITIFGESAGGESVSYQMMSPKSVQYFSRAIVQSGPSLWNWNEAQVDSGVNDIIKNLCMEVSDDCNQSATMLEIIDTLRNVSPGDLNRVYYELYSDVLAAPDWYVISKDGVFYEEDAKEQLQSGYSPYKGPVIFGTMSFEGSLLYLDSKWDKNKLKSGDIRDIFTQISQVNNVPRWQADFVVQKYFDLYSYLYPDIPHISQLSSQDSMVLAALIYGDLVERIPTMNDAIKYKQNGNKVYSFYLDAETQWDFLIGGKPRYNGTGHGRDVDYVFGSVRDERYQLLNHNLEPEDWENDATFFFETQWTRFAHRGEPWIDWTEFNENNYDTLRISQNGQFYVKMDGLNEALDFWFNEWSSSWMQEQAVFMDLKQGQVSGYLDIYNNVEKYEGIPFALPPIGSEGRWKAPRYLSNFEELEKENFQNRASCWQFDKREAKNTEDCLVLDITRPIISTNERLPVAIYIYGGSFTGGNGHDTMYNMTQYALEGVIGVTINYRVGIFGFLNYFENENGWTEGGNYGLLDQQMAIRFIHENCDFIGCDPDRITIFGESAGGSSVHYQIMSEESSNYLSGAILQSAWADFNIVYEQVAPGVNNAIRALEKEVTGKESGDDMETIIETLRQYPPHVVAHAYNRVSWRDSSYPWGWQPISRDGIFYPTDAKEKFLNGDVPFEGTIAIGTVSYEGSSSYMGCGPKCTFWSPDNITEWFWWDSYMWQVPVDQREGIIQRYFELYRSEFSDDAESFRDLSSEDLYLITSFLGMDSQTYMPTFQKARNYFKSGKSKIYSFRLDGYPQVDWIIKDQTRYQGLGHCADLPYTFGVPYFWKYSWIFEGFDPEPWEYKLNEAIKQEWTSLFKTGEPSLEGGWIEYSLENNENTFFISQNGESDVVLENRQGFEVSKALQFWDTEWNWDWAPF